MRASIIIRTYNEARYLPSLLDGIASQTLLPEEYEVIVVDSGSCDDTVKIALKYNCKIVYLARKEFSFGKSLNLGCKAANGKILVFISAHCVPFSIDWLANLLRPVEEGAVAYSFGRQIGGETTRFSEARHFLKQYPPSGVSQRIPYFCNNANAAIDAEFWKRYLFDESLSGLEDMDLAKRIYKNGSSVMYSSDACVYHFHCETGSQIIRRFEREAIALRTIEPSWNLSILEAVYFFFIAVTKDTVSLMREKGLKSKVGCILTFRFCQYYGSWRGLKVGRERIKTEKNHYFSPY